MLTKFISNRPGAFYKSGVLNNIVKLTGKKLWRSFSLPLRISKSLSSMSSSITFTIFFCDRLPLKKLNARITRMQV